MSGRRSSPGGGNRRGFGGGGGGERIAGWRDFGAYPRYNGPRYGRGGGNYYHTYPFYYGGYYYPAGYYPFALGTPGLTIVL